MVISADLSLRFALRVAAQQLILLSLRSERCIVVDCRYCAHDGRGTTSVCQCVKAEFVSTLLFNAAQRHSRANTPRTSSSSSTGTASACACLADDSRRIGADVGCRQASFACLLIACFVVAALVFLDFTRGCYDANGHRVGTCARVCADSVVPSSSPNDCNVEDPHRKCCKLVPCSFFGTASACSK